MTQPNLEFSQIDQNLSGFRDSSPPGPLRTRSIQRNEFIGMLQSPARGYKEAFQKFESRHKDPSPTTARANRFKSSERKGFLPLASASEALHENTTNMSSTGHSGKLENTLDMSGKADQLLFDNSRINPSFNVDQATLNQYPEYSMLKKLQAHVSSYSCNKCGRVYTFEKFFDDDHECLHDEEILPREAPQDDMSLEVEEFKGPESTFRLRETNTKPSSRQESVFV